jgi:hypothetical protein
VLCKPAHLRDVSYFVALQSKFARVRVLEIGFAFFLVEGLKLIV